MPLVRYIDEVLDRKGQGWRNGVTPQQKTIIERDLKGLKVKYTLPDGRKREYRCNEVMDSANKLIIPDLKKTVEQYFVDEHKKKLQHPHLPCLWLGSKNKTIYIPLEFCEMSSQALPRNKTLSEKAQGEMVRKTAVRPGDRERKILQELKMNNNIHNNDPFAKAFNISVADHLLTLKARILPPPTIAYNKGKVVEISATSPGSWRSQRYVEGKSVKNWAVLDLARLNDNEYKDVVGAFKQEGGKLGVNFDADIGRTVFKYICDNDRHVGKDFRKIIEDFKKFKTKLDLVLVVLPFKGGGAYNEIKRLGDIEFRVPTQCVVKQVLFRQGRVNYQVVGNLCLKINSKLSGVNHQLADSSRPEALKEPIMILGADVTHAAAQFKGIKPSIAAVVGSTNPSATQYEVEIRVQDTEQNEEMINDMKDVVEKLLRKYYNTTGGRKPGRLIMFRDGVSEGQFQSVMARELMAIRAACSSVQRDGYQPKITYIVVQKRHHTRFFPTDNNKYEKNGNALAGTVVDQGINHPTEGDYYLLSHEGIQVSVVIYMYKAPCPFVRLFNLCNSSSNRCTNLLSKNNRLQKVS